jgi:hypothetical protein
LNLRRGNVGTPGERLQNPLDFPEMVMKRSSLLNSAMLLMAAASAACAGTSTLPQSSVHVMAPHSARFRSWTAANLGPQDLLYVSNSNGLVNIYHYWQKTLVGILTNFNTPMGECVDNKRNVYITDYAAETIVEYPHGGSTAIRTIKDSPYAPDSCAIDPTSGDLAVANYDTPATYSYNDDDGNVAIYTHGKGKPHIYGNKQGRFTTLGYDDAGDLLATDLDYYYYGFYYTTYFYYLPKHGTQALKIDLPNNQFTSSSYGWPAAQSINYDGTYWVVTADNTMFRYTIGVNAQEIDDMPLTGASGYVAQIALYRRTAKSQAVQAVAADGNYHRANIVDYWKYPVSGDPFATLSSDLDAPYGAAISLRTSK